MSSKSLGIDSFWAATCLFPVIFFLVNRILDIRPATALASGLFIAIGITSACIGRGPLGLGFEMLDDTPLRAHCTAAVLTNSYIFNLIILALSLTSHPAVDLTPAYILIRTGCGEPRTDNRPFPVIFPAVSVRDLASTAPPTSLSFATYLQLTILNYRIVITLIIADYGPLPLSRRWH